jgi:phosphatidylglycerophosphatase A
MNALTLLLATGCYTGYVPKAPGTAGSLLGVLIAWALTEAPPPLYAAVIVAGLPAGIWVAQRAEGRFGHDGRQIVIDEILGMLLTLAWLPPGWLTFGLGFVLFRIMDVIKLFPANRAQKLRGGLGVVADDVVAAVYAHFLVRYILLLLG